MLHGPLEGPSLVSDVVLAVERWLFPLATTSSYNCVELSWQTSKENQSNRGIKKAFFFFSLLDFESLNL